MRIVLAMLLIATSFAGCFDVGAETASATTSSSSGASSPNATSTPPASASNTTSAPNSPPVASMEVDNASGAMPLNVTFTIDATDADGDPLTWSLAPGDASENMTGDALPANVTYTYAAVGNFTATLEVSDGVHVVNLTVAINVDAAASGGAMTHVITGSTLIPFPPGDLVACLNDDIDGNIYDLAPAAPGWSYTLEPGDGSFGVYWYAGGDYQESGEPTGVVPEEMDQVEICNLSAAPGAEYTMTLTSP